MISIFFFSCGTNNFAKRKYTKGVYIEKRSSASSRKLTVESDSYRISSDNQKSAKAERAKKIEEIESTTDYADSFNKTKDEENKTETSNSPSNSEQQEDYRNNQSAPKKEVKDFRTKQANKLIIFGSLMMGGGAVLLAFTYVSIAMAVVGAILFLLGLTLLIVGLKNKPKKEINVKELSADEIDKADKRAVVSLALGIISILLIGIGYGFALLFWSGLVLMTFHLVAGLFGLISFVVGSLNFKKWIGLDKKKRSMTIAGFVLGIIGFLVGMGLGIPPLVSLLL